MNVSSLGIMKDLILVSHGDQESSKTLIISRKLDNKLGAVSGLVKKLASF